MTEPFPPAILLPQCCLNTLRSSRATANGGRPQTVRCALWPGRRKAVLRDTALPCLPCSNGLAQAVSSSYAGAKFPRSSKQSAGAA